MVINFLVWLIFMRVSLFAGFGLQAALPASGAIEVVVVINVRLLLHYKFIKQQGPAWYAVKKPSSMTAGFA